MTHAEVMAEVKSLHERCYPNGCRPSPDWCVECAARLTGRTEAEVFADVEADRRRAEVRESFSRIRRNRACYRCGASPEHCECPDQYEPD